MLGNDELDQHRRLRCRRRHDGGTVGYNWQTGTFVFGLEGDIDWASVKGTSNNVGCLGGGCTSENTWLGTARGRLGYAFDRLRRRIGGQADPSATAQAAG